jgi:hypothetical protein
MEIVSREMLEALAAEGPQSKRGSTSNHNSKPNNHFDVERFLDKHHIELSV